MTLSLITATLATAPSGADDRGLLLAGVSMRRKVRLAIA